MAKDARAEGGLPFPPLDVQDLDISWAKCMPVDILRLRTSQAWRQARKRPELGFYSFNMWSAAWLETPPGSLPNDDEALAEAAMCPDVARWRALKSDLLADWTLCRDGRWYHPFVVQKVMETAATVKRNKGRTAAATAAATAARKAKRALQAANQPDLLESRAYQRNVERDVAPSIGEIGDVAKSITYQRNVERDVEPAGNVENNVPHANFSGDQGDYRSISTGSQRDVHIKERRKEGIENLSPPPPVLSPASAVHEQPGEGVGEIDMPKAPAETGRTAQQSPPPPADVPPGAATPSGGQKTGRSGEDNVVALVRPEAVRVIGLYDAIVAEVFGPEHRRPWPAPADAVFARRWLDRGASFDLLAGAFLAVCERRKQRGDGPWRSMEFLDGSVDAALAAERRAVAPTTQSGVAPTPPRRHRLNRVVLTESERNTLDWYGEDRLRASLSPERFKQVYG